MPNCSNALESMTPGEAIRCGYSAVSNGIDTLVNKISSVTIGEWTGAIVGFGLLPAMLASWFLPFLFIGRLIGRYLQKDRYEVTDPGKRRQKFWCRYMIIAGMVSLWIASGDRFMISVGVWETIGGLAILIAGPSWWGKRYANDGRVLSE